MTHDAIAPIASPPARQRPSRSHLYAYQRPDAQLTLEEGYAEYVAANAGDGFVDESDLENTSAAFFRNHDFIHVVFGLDTHLEHEILADVWTFFAVDIGVIAYLRYALSTPEAKDTFKQVGGLGFALKSAWRVLPKVWKAYCVSRRMTKRWPWSDHDRFRRVPLVEIRREFGISLVH